VTEPDLTGLTCGATGQPAVTTPADELALLRHQQKTIGWHDATPLVRDAAQAYREITAGRDKTQQPAPGRYL
jgi:hypothetical protein